MLRTLKNIVLFQRRIVPLSILFSLPITIMTGGISPGFGYSVLITSLCIHYWAYDVRRPQEYYYYYNFGLGRLQLWLSTLVIGMLISSLLAVL